MSLGDKLRDLPFFPYANQPPSSDSSQIEETLTRLTPENQTIQNPDNPNDIELFLSRENSLELNPLYLQRCKSLDTDWDKLFSIALGYCQDDNPALCRLGFKLSSFCLENRKIHHQLAALRVLQYLPNALSNTTNQELTSFLDNIKPTMQPLLDKWLLTEELWEKLQLAIDQNFISIDTTKKLIIDCLQNGGISESASMLRILTELFLNEENYDKKWKPLANQIVQKLLCWNSLEALYFLYNLYKKEVFHRPELATLLLKISYALKKDAQSKEQQFDMTRLYRLFIDLMPVISKKITSQNVNEIISWLIANCPLPNDLDDLLQSAVANNMVGTSSESIYWSILDYCDLLLQHPYQGYDSAKSILNKYKFDHTSFSSDFQKHFARFLVKLFLAQKNNRENYCVFGDFTLTRIAAILQNHPEHNAVRKQIRQKQLGSLAEESSRFQDILTEKGENVCLTIVECIEEGKTPEQEEVCRDLIIYIVERVIASCDDSEITNAIEILSKKQVQDIFKALIEKYLSLWTVCAKGCMRLPPQQCQTVMSKLVQQYSQTLMRNLPASWAKLCEFLETFTNRRTKDKIKLTNSSKVILKSISSPALGNLKALQDGAIALRFIVEMQKILGCPLNGMISAEDLLWVVSSVLRESPQSKALSHSGSSSKSIENVKDLIDSAYQSSLLTIDFEPEQQKDIHFKIIGCLYHNMSADKLWKWLHRLHALQNDKNDPVFQNIVKIISSKWLEASEYAYLLKISSLIEIAELDDPNVWINIFAALQKNNEQQFLDDLFQVYIKSANHFVGKGHPTATLIQCWSYFLTFQGSSKNQHFLALLEKESIFQKTIPFETKSGDSAKLRNSLLSLCIPIAQKENDASILQTYLDQIFDFRLHFHDAYYPELFSLSIDSSLLTLSCKAQKMAFIPIQCLILQRLHKNNQFSEHAGKLLSMLTFALNNSNINVEDIFAFSNLTKLSQIEFDKHFKGLDLIQIHLLYAELYFLFSDLEAMQKATEFFITALDKIDEFHDSNKIPKPWLVKCSELFQIWCEIKNDFLMKSFKMKEVITLLFPLCEKNLLDKRQIQSDIALLLLKHIPLLTNEQVDDNNIADVYYLILLILKEFNQFNDSGISELEHRCYCAIMELFVYSAGDEKSQLLEFLTTLNGHEWLARIALSYKKSTSTKLEYKLQFLKIYEEFIREMCSTIHKYNNCDSLTYDSFMWHLNYTSKNKLFPASLIRKYGKEFVFAIIPNEKGVIPVKHFQIGGNLLKRLILNHDFEDYKEVNEFEMYFNLLTPFETGLSSKDLVSILEKNIRTLCSKNEYGYTVRAFNLLHNVAHEYVKNYETVIINCFKMVFESVGEFFPDKHLRESFISRLHLFIKQRKLVWEKVKDAYFPEKQIKIIDFPFPEVEDAEEDFDSDSET